jgi:hypothetical protein
MTFQGDNTFRFTHLACLYKKIQSLFYRIIVLIGYIYTDRIESEKLGQVLSSLPLTVLQKSFLLPATQMVADFNKIPGTVWH